MDGRFGPADTVLAPTEVVCISLSARGDNGGEIAGWIMRLDCAVLTQELRLIDVQSLITKYESFLLLLILLYTLQFRFNTTLV